MNREWLPASQEGWICCLTIGPSYDRQQVGYLSLKPRKELIYNLFSTVPRKNSFEHEECTMCFHVLVNTAVSFPRHASGRDEAIGISYWGKRCMMEETH
jgi:hypothetical protein